jgi:hypothetical protein
LPLPTNIPLSLTFKELNVPTCVNELSVTELFIVVPVNVSALAVTLILFDPSKFTPFMVRAVANLVADPALPDSVAPIN